MAMTPDRTRGYGPRRRFTLVTLLLLVGCCGAAAAQRLSLSLDGALAGAAAAPSVTVGVSGLRARGNDFDAWARAGLQLELEGATAATGTFGVGAAWRRATIFGPLGNVIVEGGGSLATPALGTTTALGRTWLGARGTIGSVALTLAAEAGNAAPGQLDPGRPAPPDATGQAALRELDGLRARTGLAAGAWDAGARVGLIYRVDRDVSLSLDAAGRALAGTPLLDGQLALRRARLAGDVDGWLGFQAQTHAGAAAFAVGVGAFHAPRRGATSWLRAWLGAGPEGVRPGVEGSWVHRLRVGEVRAQLAVRPWLGASAWQAEAGFDHSLRAGDVRWTIGALGTTDAATTWRFGVRLTRPLARP